MRFYPGTDAMGWLTRTPSVMVSACIAMLPRLDAEEAIAHVNQVGLAFGSLEAGPATTLRQQWTTAAAGRDTHPTARHDPDALRRAGFAVRRVPKRKAS
jgi:hypothetical protein